MGLHICYDLAAAEHADVRSVLADLRRFASALPFADVGPLMTSADAGATLTGSEWLLPLDANGGVHERDWEAPRGMPLAALTVAPVEWHGFHVIPGRGCESATFGLARHRAMVEHADRRAATGLDGRWRWHWCCKTQHASAVSWEHFMTLHGSVVSVLQHANDLGIVEEVRDETGFWADRDWASASRRVDEMNAVVRSVRRAVEGLLDPDAD